MHRFSETTRIECIPQRDFLLYLGGPVTGVSYSGAMEWRALAAKMLPPWIRPLSPLRGTEGYLKGESEIAPHYDGYPLSTPRGITSQCKFDILRCDMALFNFLDAERISIGSCIEVGWADMANKPIVLVIEPHVNPHDHPILDSIAGWRVSTLEEGIEIVRTVLTPGV